MFLTIRALARVIGRWAWRWLVARPVIGACKWGWRAIKLVLWVALIVAVLPFAILLWPLVVFSALYCKRLSDGGWVCLCLLLNFALGLFLAMQYETTQWPDWMIFLVCMFLPWLLSYAVVGVAELYERRKGLVPWLKKAPGFLFSWVRARGRSAIALGRRLARPVSEAVETEKALLTQARATPNEEKLGRPAEPVNEEHLCRAVSPNGQTEDPGQLVRASVSPEGEPNGQ